MLLAAEQAQDIVEEIGAIVRQNINMMDADGVIIASTDPTRLGNFHAGAKRVIDEGLSELYIGSETAQQATPPMRMGINLPLTYERHIVGVVGITGEYESVIGYGQVVKKMTEILIRERVQEEARRLDLRVTSRFLEEWVLGAGILRPALLAARGRQLGIDIARRRRVMVVSLDDVEDHIDSFAGQELIERVENAVLDMVRRDSSALILRHAARQILLLGAAEDSALLALAKELAAMVRTKFEKTLRVGFDEGRGNIREAYGQADRAWRTAVSLPDRIAGFGALDLEFFLQEISAQTKFEYIEKIFHAYGEAERAEIMELLRAYFSAGGSLKKTAADLFIHKNTLQYKLHRMEHMTGYDVRQPRHAAVFAMALQFYDEMRREKSYAKRGIR
ncbi:MAG: CdaR family transcriptional regulator [Schwartzia sp. (in: firmicutes)]